MACGGELALASVVDLRGRSQLQILLDIPCSALFLEKCSAAKFP